MAVTLDHTDAIVVVDELGDGMRRITVQPKCNKFLPCSNWDTHYSLDMIDLMLETAGLWIVDAIMHEENPLYVPLEIKWEVLSYIDDKDLDGCRLLDFGSGGGSSSIVLSRIAPSATVVGVELREDFVRISRRIAEFYGVSDRVHFHISPSPRQLPPDLGQFDFIFLSAVYEHLLPGERAQLMPLLWSHLKTGGILFLNQTPHRWFPVEHHTTGLPLVNYLPDGLTAVCARTFSKRMEGDETWETLLRKGIRGATHGGVLAELNRDGRKALSLQPKRFGANDHIELWYRYSNTLQPTALRKLAMWGMEALKKATGMTLTPYISLAIRKIA